MISLEDQVRDITWLGGRLGQLFMLLGSLNQVINHHLLKWHGPRDQVSLNLVIFEHISLLKIYWKHSRIQVHGATTHPSDTPDCSLQGCVFTTLHVVDHPLTVTPGQHPQWKVSLCGQASCSKCPSMLLHAYSIRLLHQTASRNCYNFYRAPAC